MQLDNTKRVVLKSMEPSMYDIEACDIPGIHPHDVKELNARPLTLQELKMIRQYIYLRTSRKLDQHAVEYLVEEARLNGRKHETLVAYGSRSGLLARLGT